MIVYTLMDYNYEQTDILLATDKLEEILEQEPHYILSVWENGVKVEVYFSVIENKWGTSWNESVLDKEEIDLFHKFLRVNNLK